MLGSPRVLVAFPGTAMLTASPYRSNHSREGDHIGRCRCRTFCCGPHITRQWRSRCWTTPPALRTRRAHTCTLTHCWADVPTHSALPHFHSIPSTRELGNRLAYRAGHGNTLRHCGRCGPRWTCDTGWLDGPVWKSGEDQACKWSLHLLRTHELDSRTSRSTGAGGTNYRSGWIYRQQQRTASSFRGKTARTLQRSSSLPPRGRERQKVATGALACDSPGKGESGRGLASYYRP